MEKWRDYLDLCAIRSPVDWLYRVGKTALETERHLRATISMETCTQ